MTPEESERAKQKKRRKLRYGYWGLHVGNIAHAHYPSDSKGPIKTPLTIGYAMGEIVKQLMEREES